MITQPKNEVDYIRIGFEIKSLDGEGSFAGYAAVWDERDSIDDVCRKGAFAETLKAWEARGTLPRVRWQHYDAIGHITAMREDDRGLYVEGRIWDGAVVAQIKEAMSRGGVGMSFAFVAVDYEIESGVRYLNAVALMDDVTLTLRPVQTSAGVTEVKSADGSRLPSARTLESVLRDAGCSRQAAKRLLACGMGSMRDASADMLPGLTDLLGAVKSI